MKAQKATPPFHMLTSDEARQWYEDGLLTTTGYLWAIRRITCPPNGRFVIPNVVAFCEKWSISRAAFYRAVKQLDKDGYMSWEATQGLAFTDSNKKVVDFPSEENKCPTSGTVSHERDSQSHERDSQSRERNTDIYKDRARDQINSDKFKSLSDSEREKFLEFVEKEASQMAKPPLLIENFAAAHFTELYKRFLASPAGRDAKAKAIAAKYDWENDPRLMDWLHKAYYEGHPWAVADEFEREERLAFLMWAQDTNAYEGRVVHDLT